MSVTIAAEAERDLASISAFIGAQNPARAITFIRELVANCHALAEHPLRHAVVLITAGT